MGVNESDSRPKHEVQDMEPKAALLFALALALGLVLVHFICAGVFRYFMLHPSRHPAPSPLAASREQFSGPRLLVNQAQDMDQLRSAEDAALNHYQWVDRDRGIVRIPIDQAIRLLAGSGTATNITPEELHP